MRMQRHSTSSSGNAHHQSADPLLSRQAARGRGQAGHMGVSTGKRLGRLDGTAENAAEVR